MMKTTTTRMMAVLATMLVSMGGAMASELEGYWVNRENDLIIEVEDTYDGIKVKRDNTSRWRYYERSRGGIFYDANGDNYQAVRNDKLLWSGARGKRKIAFVRYFGPNRQNVRGSYSGTYQAGYGDRVQSYNRSGSASVGLDKRQLRKLRVLEGRWISNRGSRDVSIIVTPRGVVLSGWNGKQIFRPGRDGMLYNNQGQCLHVRGNNRLIIKNGGRRGRDIIFTRARRNAYCE